METPSERLRSLGQAVDQAIRRIGDPAERVRQAVAAHREVRDLTARLSTLRREAFVALHDAGYTWQEVADVADMTKGATLKVVNAPPQREDWWKRLPDEVVATVKLGPGGIPKEKLIPRVALMSALVDAMAEYQTELPGSRGILARITREELTRRLSEHFGRTISQGSLRNALLGLMEVGKIERAGVGRYVLTGRGRSVVKRSTRAGDRGTRSASSSRSTTARRGS